MPDPAPFPDQGPEGPAAAEGSASATPHRQGWPLWLRLTLAAVILTFVWSPFLAMLARLSQVRPSLQPTGGAPLLAPPSPPSSAPATSTAPGTQAAP